jgi:predicted nucleic acid-binding protein
VGVYFLDSSALLKRYVNEAGTAWVQSLFDPTLGHHLAIATISGAEIVAAVTRRTRSGGISATDSSKVIQQFKADFQTEFDLVDISVVVVQLAMELANRHGLRGYDAVQLAAASTLDTGSRSRSLGGATLVSSDLELNTAAVAHGISVENPALHP